MRLLLTGKTGFLGRTLASDLASSYDVLPPFRLDFLEPGWEERLAALRPELVVHTAALADPDRCEADPDRARAVNVDATRRLLEVVEPSCERFLYCSTDLVFDGGSSFYKEADAPRPIQLYGRTKLEAEDACRAFGDRAVVVRLALLIGPQGKFLAKLLEDVRSSRPANLFIDQFRTPLHLEDAAKGIRLLLTLADPPRLVHMGGPDRLSRYDMGLVACRAFGLDSTLLVPKRMEEVESLAPRPADVSLDISLARSLGFSPRGFEDGLSSPRA